MKKKKIVERIKKLYNFQEIGYEKVGARKLNRGAKSIFFGV